MKSFRQTTNNTYYTYQSIDIRLITHNCGIQTVSLHT